MGHLQTPRPPLLIFGLLAALLLACGGSSDSTSPPTAPTSYYLVAPLVSDQATAGAAHTDSNLVNPWGIAYGPSTYFWTANTGSGTSTLYDGTGTPMPATPLIVTVPPAAGGSKGSPIGVIFNASADFKGDKWIFSTLDGTISGSSAGTSAVIRVDNSTSHAAYTGLAAGSVTTTNYIYASNFAAGSIDVFDTNYAPVNLGSGVFTDPGLPTGYYPYNIQNLAGKLYVAYAERNASGYSTAGAGLGYVSVFNPDGAFVKRLVSAGMLNAPWGLALAPATFGGFGGALLVGNFGDGHITAYDATSGNELGQLTDSQGNPLAIGGLWGLIFGNGTNAGSTSVLYFTAGVNFGAHGLFGSITFTQAPTGGSGGGGGGGGGGY